ncbi:GNAT family N-acetyltransferase [Streptomyces sp. NPDC057702]|uniref:GNAT family N-acetyltransferase n=1 Tax=unclassified Streptomyces TaxID=2593676 RepID=UPI003691D433
MAQLTFRQAREEDHAPIVASIQNWWGETRTPDEARELSLLLPRLFLQHFAATSLILEEHPDPERPDAERPEPTRHIADGEGAGANAARPAGTNATSAPTAASPDAAGTGPGGTNTSEPHTDGTMTNDADADDAGSVGSGSARPAGALVGFLVGFHSPDRPGTAYIHFVGVHPGLRHQGVARKLYERFFARAVKAGRLEVRSIVSPANKPSIAFHHAMGFVPEGGDYLSDGVPVHRDYDGPGHDRISFRRVLTAAPAAQE